MKGVEHNKLEGDLEISYQCPPLSPFVSPLILSLLSFLPQVLVVLSVHSQEKDFSLERKICQPRKFLSPRELAQAGALGTFWGGRRGS